MILYNVTVNIDESVEKEWLQWMIEVHIPEVMNTGLFVSSKVCRIHAEEVGGSSYSIQYFANNMDDYDTYQKLHSPALQKEHARKYAGKFAAFRTILEVIQEF